MENEAFLYYIYIDYISTVHLLLLLRINALIVAASGFVLTIKREV